MLLCSFKVLWAVAGCYCVAKDFECCYAVSRELWVVAKVLVWFLELRNVEC